MDELIGGLSALTRNWIVLTFIDTLCILGLLQFSIENIVKAVYDFQTFKVRIPD